MKQYNKPTSYETNQSASKIALAPEAEAGSETTKSTQAQVEDKKDETKKDDTDD